MAGIKKTRTELINDLLAVITTNGNKQITAAAHRQLLEDLIESTALLKVDAGLRPHSPTRSYDAGETAIQDGQIFSANSNATQGAFSEDDWTVLPLNAELIAFAPYDNATTYQIDQVVSFNLKIYASLSGGNQGNQPDISPANWVELSQSTGHAGINVNVQTIETIAVDHQYFVFGIYTIAPTGILVINPGAELVIMEGDFNLNGQLNNFGTLTFVAN